MEEETAGSNPVSHPKNEYRVYYSSISKKKPTVVFIGTYPPRECGIATFNQDLLKSSQKFLGKTIACKVVAMNLSVIDTYTYPPEVKWQLDQNNVEEHVALANKLNNDDFVTGVMIQHEYGIYGGLDGENILSFINTFKKPIVVTLHTVLPNPSEHMKKVTSDVIKSANIVVVLTESSKKILLEVYPESTNKVHVIPHGIHQTHFEDTTFAKKRLDFENKTVLSTFGLLSRGKGIEYVINSLPKIIEKDPSVVYLVLGETHPVIRRQEGESYRKELAELVANLHLKKHVKFYDQYLSIRDLIEFLKATDIYISTSVNPDQAVSGTLSYALGTGRAVISTQFAQAREIVTPEVGRLVPVKDPEAYTNALEELLNNRELLKSMNKKAYEQTRPMLWSNVAKEYSKLLQQNIWPPINLDHLKKMTDSFGLFQFATHDKPNKEFGYTLDDNARALIIASKLNSSKINIYLRFIESCQLKDGTFINYLDHARKAPTVQNKEEDLEDAAARAMWALGEVIFLKKAREMFLLSLPTASKFRHLRASSFIIKALVAAVEYLPEHREEFISIIHKNADYLVSELTKHSHKSWYWFDKYLSYNNGIIPEALMLAGELTHTKVYIEKGEKALNFLISKTFSENRYMPIGHSHWYRNKEKRSHFDQQPEDPASMILALVTAYKITQDETHRKLVDICFSWFLGNNSLGLPLYNYETGGCFDGLHPDRVNQNQGAESLVSYLLARIAIEKV